MAPNEKAVDKIPSVPGLLLYRLNNKKLFIQGEKQWNEIAMEKELQVRVYNFFTLDKRTSV